MNSELFVCISGAALPVGKDGGTTVGGRKPLETKEATTAGVSCRWSWWAFCYAPLADCE